MGKLKISKYVQAFVDATKKLEKPVIEMVEQTIDPETGAVTAVEKTDEKEAASEEAASEEAASEGTAEGEKPAEEGEQDTTGTGEEEAPMDREEEEILLDVPIDPDYPVNNYGIPLFVVGLKGDFFATSINQIGATDKFECVTSRLRKKCLDWGATLIYTSAAGEGVNADVMVDQVYHRLFQFPLLHPPKVFGTSTDYAIHVPAGYDKLSLIELSTSKWDDSVHLKTVFGLSSSKGKAEKKQQTIQAKPDAEFFASLQEQLKTGKRRVDPNVRKSDTKKKKEKAVKSFFKSLLSKE